MNGTMEWADLSRLIEQDFHFYTQALFELETELATPIHDSLHWSRRFEYPWILLQLRAMSSWPLGPVLDAGAGATALQFFLARSGAPTTSIDIDQSAVDWVNSKSPKKLWVPAVMSGGAIAVTEGPKPRSAWMKLPELPFPDQSFDTSLCISVLEHMPKFEVMAAVKNLQRVAKRKVLITMDVCLSAADQMDVASFLPLVEALGVEAKPLPQTALTFEIHGHRFGVACLNLNV